MTNNEEELVLFSPQIEIFAPFSSAVDASRGNMSAKQMNQCIISSNVDTPLIINKHFKKITEINSPFIEYAEDDGHVIFSDHETLIIYYTHNKKIVTKSVPSIKKLVNNSLSLKYVAPIGTISKGDILYDYTGLDLETHMPKIGYRANILFHSFFGWTSDDAIVISESFSKKAKIEYSHKIFIPITKNWKYLRNERDNYFYKLGEILPDEYYSRYFFIDAGDHFLAEVHNMSEQPTMFFTKSIKGIKEGEIISIKVHKNTQKSFNELKKEYIYTPGLIEEVEEFYKDNQTIHDEILITFEKLGMGKEEATKYADEIFSSNYSVKKFPKNFETKCQEKFNIEPELVDFLIEVNIKYVANTTRGDKFTNLFAGKGTVSMIVPDNLMPKDPQTGKPFDMIFNPLGIFGRNNWGVIFELALSKIIDDVEFIAKECIDEESSVGLNLEKCSDLLERIQFIADNFIEKYDKEYYEAITEQMLPGIISGMQHENFEPIRNLINDINAKGFYIFIPNFPGISYNEFFEDFIKKYAEKFNINIGKSKVKIDKNLIKWFRKKWNFDNLILSDVYDVDIRAFTGKNYFLKLYHTSFSKFTAVSLASSYSKITGQPARGRKRVGGQHISWQSLAALLGHKEKNGMLKELYTIKSDSPIKDKENFIMQYITKGEYDLKPNYTSLTKKAINNALKILGMKFDEKGKK